MSILCAETEVVITITNQEIERKAGADDCFIKPFSPLDLIRKIQDTLV